MAYYQTWNSTVDEQQKNGSRMCIQINNTNNVRPQLRGNSGMTSCLTSKRKVKSMCRLCVDMHNYIAMIITLQTLPAAKFIRALVGSCDLRT